MMSRLALALALCAVPGAALADPLTGPARVIDGDTIVVDGMHVRLAGIDAPEMHQQCRIGGAATQCGVAAKAEMMKLTKRRAVTCQPLTRDSYGRTVARCSTLETPDLGEAMVRDGWAIRWPRYDADCRYCDADAAARRERRGLWAGSFVMPWEWRHTMERSR